MPVDPVQLRCFAAVAEHLHFGRAARALGMSRPAVSRAVVDLEAALGVDLFVRPSERTELTPAGVDLRERAPALLAEAEPATPAADGTAPFRVATVPGVVVSKWARIWAERVPDVALELVRAEEETQVAVLHDGAADVAFVRLPVDRDGLSVIPLYREVPVVVVPKDHVATVQDEVSTADLADENLLQDPAASPADLIALVAAGVGIVIVPMSVARMHHRRDVTYRPVTDVDETQVALAWLSERTTDQVEEFVGIVRGRSPRSSRSAAAGSPAGRRSTQEPPSGRSTRTSPAGTRRRRR